MHSSTIRIVRSDKSLSKLKVPQVVAGKRPPPMVNSCPVMPKYYELGESFDLQHDISSVNRS